MSSEGPLDCSEPPVCPPPPPGPLEDFAWNATPLGAGSESGGSGGSGGGGGGGQTCCPDDPSCDDPPCPTNGVVTAPNGGIAFTEVDLPSPVLGFAFKRQFRNRVFKLNDIEGPAGYNWQITEQPFINLRVTSSGKGTVNFRSGRTQVRFDRTGTSPNDVYTARNGLEIRYQLEAGAGNTFVLTDMRHKGGVKFTFYGFDGSIDADLRGRFKSREDFNGGKLEAFHDAGNGYRQERSVYSHSDGTTTRYWEHVYTYLSAGDHAGQLDHVTLNELDVYPSPTVTTPIRRVRYQYYPAATQPDDHGNLNDLQAAVRQQPDGSGGWEDTEVCYYRYYVPTGTDPQGNPKAANGFVRGLKYAVDPAGYVDLIENGHDPAGIVGSATTDSDDTLAVYADKYFEYDPAHRVTREVSRSCAGCGGGGSASGAASGADTGAGGERFKRDRSRFAATATPTDYNTWVTRTAITRPNGHKTLIYSNEINQTMLRVERDANTQEWFATYTEYDGNGHVVLVAEPNAVTGFDESLADLVGKQSATSYLHLRANGGLIRQVIRYPSTTATDSAAGGVKYWKHKEVITEGTAGIGNSGEEIVLKAWDYIASPSGTGYEAVYVLASETVYTADDGGESDTTHYDYAWYTPDTTPATVVPQIKERVTELPPVPTDENGTNTAHDRREFYDPFGNRTWAQDERNVLTYLAYDPEGRVTQRVDDADGSSPAKPGGWPSPPSPPLHLATTYSYDTRGRLLETIGPEHDAVTDPEGTPASTTLKRFDQRFYVDAILDNTLTLGNPVPADQAWSGQGYVSGGSNYTLIDPVTIAFTDRRGRMLDRVVSKRTSGSGKLSGSDTFDRADWSRWAVWRYDIAGNLSYQRAYHDIPAQTPTDQGLAGINDDPGLAGTHYDETFYGYDGATGRRVRVKAPSGTITRTVHDVFERSIATYVGTDDLGIDVYGVAARWELDEDSVDGSTALDDSGLGKNGTLNNFGTPGFAEGPDGNALGALEFDGTGDYVQTPFVLDPAETSFSACAWIYLESTYATDPTGVLSQQGSSGGNVGRPWLRVGGDNQSNRLVTALAGNNLWGTTTITKNAWHHVALTVQHNASGDETVKIYLDGALEAQGNRAVESAVGDMIIGANKNPVWDLFDGRIAKVSIFNRLLSSAEIDLLYQNPGGLDRWELWDPANPDTAGNMVLVAGSAYPVVNAPDHDGAMPMSPRSQDAHTAARANSKRTTTYGYDFRGRRTSTTQGNPGSTSGSYEGLYTQTTYDTMNRPIEVVRRAGSPTELLIGRAQTLYDPRGRVYRTRTFGIDPDDGTVGHALTGNFTFDASGNLIEQTPEGGGVMTTWTEYDNLARVTETRTGYVYDPDVSDREIDATITRTTYDEANNAIEVVTQELDTGSTTGAGGQSFRTTYQFQWFDALGRRIASANYGALGSDPGRPTTPPAPADDKLVTDTFFNDRGEQYKTVDPKDIQTRQTFDDMGRLIQVVEAYTDGTPTVNTNRTTAFTYHPSGQKATETAVNLVDNGAGSITTRQDQVTTYTYGVTNSGPKGSSLYSNDLLATVAYPDSSGGSDVVKYQYNRQGQVYQKTDQNGTVHKYLFDALGRMTFDIAVTLGTGIHAGVRRLSTRYNPQGLPAFLTSHANTAANYDTAEVNQVRLVYNDFGQLVLDEQQHFGKLPEDASPGATAPTVQYDYADASASSNTIRPNGWTFPSSREIDFDYGTSGGGGIDDGLNRLTQINESSSTRAEYAYLGMATPVRVDYPEPDLRLDLWGGASGVYNGIDMFGRITDQHWTQDPSGSNTTVAQLQYGYDRNSNRLYRQDPLAIANGENLDELYTYDDLNRLNDMQRGQLNGTKDAIAGGTLDFRQNWTLDPLGNWPRFNEDDDGNGTYDLQQERVVNPVNEITDITQTAGPSGGWVDPEYDAAGQMTKMPRPGDETDDWLAVYDAWGRMVKVQAAPDQPGYDPNKVINWSYDARGYRITEDLRDRPAYTQAFTGTDVGSSTPAGSFGTSSITNPSGSRTFEYEVQGGGAGIGSGGGTADSFYFLHRQATGGDLLAGKGNELCLTAEINALTGTQSGRQAGLMIREDTSASSKHAFVSLDGSGGVEFTIRTSSGGTTTLVGTNQTQSTVSVKLLRRGDTFSAYYREKDSVTGNFGNWSQLGTDQTITMTGEPYFGMAVSSVDPGTSTATANFRDLEIGTPVRHFYYTNHWQRIEERHELDNTLSLHAQWLPGARYIDDHLLRDVVATPGDSVIDPDERKYYLSDANWNTVAIVGKTATGPDVWGVQERYAYQPYGTPVYLESDFSTKSTQESAYSIEALCQGLVITPHIILYLGRFRVLQPALALWTRRDPQRYADGNNLYCLAFFSQNLNDPLGLQASQPAPWGTSEFLIYYQSNNMGQTIHLASVGLLSTYVNSGPVASATSQMEQTAINGAYSAMNWASSTGRLQCPNNTSYGPVTVANARLLVNATSVIYVLGSGWLNMTSECTYTLRCCCEPHESSASALRIDCDIHYYLRDMFIDALDVTNSIPGNQDLPWATPFPIHADWRINWSNTITYQCP